MGVPLPSQPIPERPSTNHDPERAFAPDMLLLQHSHTRDVGYSRENCEVPTPDPRAVSSGSTVVTSVSLVP